nr:MFS transporter [Paracoccaceae bacterium]
VLDRLGDRPVMLAGAGLLAGGMLVGPLATGLGGLLPLWAALGVGYSATQTPAGRLLRRSALPEDRPALFAAQFALSHACWLITYPLAGMLGAAAGLDATFLAMAAISLGAILAARAVWPAQDPGEIAHSHADLALDHPHLAEVPPGPGRRHTHSFVIDSLHPDWPRPA